MSKTVQTAFRIDNQCFTICSPDIQGEQSKTYPITLLIL